MMRKALVIAVGVLLVGVQARAQVAPPPDPLDEVSQPLDEDDGRRSGGGEKVGGSAVVASSPGSSACPQRAQKCASTGFGVPQRGQGTTRFYGLPLRRRRLLS